MVNERTGGLCYLYGLSRSFLDGVYDLGPTLCVVADMPDFMGNGLMGYDVFWNNTVFFDNGRGEAWSTEWRGSAPYFRTTKEISGSTCASRAAGSSPRPPRVSAGASGCGR